MWQGTAPRGSQGDPGLDPRPSELPGSYTTFAETKPSSGSQLQTQVSGSRASSAGIECPGFTPRTANPAPLRVTLVLWSRWRPVARV